VRIRNISISQWRTSVFGTKLFPTLLFCFPLLRRSQYYYSLVSIIITHYYINYNVVRYCQKSLQQIRISPTFFALLIVQQLDFHGRIRHRNLTLEESRAGCSFEVTAGKKTHVKYSKLQNLFNKRKLFTDSVICGLHN
jgi:hypothetical protein